MHYLAEWEGGNIFIAKDSDMDEYLAMGARIYAKEDILSDEKTLIATPEDGFLVERPVITGCSRRE